MKNDFLKRPIFWVFVLGFIFRILGLSWELKDLRLGDELYLVVDALRMAAAKSPFPAIYSYGGITYYILVFAYGLFYLFGLLFGLFKNPNDFAMLYMTDSFAFFYIGRLISLVAGMLIGVIVYKLARRLFDSTAAFIAATFVMVAPVFVEHSKLAQADIIMLLFVSVAFYFSFTTHIKANYLKSCILTGIFSGLAITTKYTAALILIPVFLNQFLIFLETKQARLFLKGAIVTFAFAIILFIMGSPFWVFDFEKAWSWFFKVKSGVDVPWGVLPVKTGIFPGFIWLIWEIIRQETTIGMLFLASLVYSLLRRNRLDICYLSFFIVYIIAIRGWNKRMLHYVIALFPLMSIFAAGMLNDLVSFLASRNKKLSISLITNVLLAVVCFVPVGINVVEIYGKLHLSTREIARDWVEANIESGTKIAVDDFHTGVPLLGKSHFLLYETPATREEVDKILPKEITQSYADWVKDKRHYDLYSIIVAKDIPGWPSDMSKGILEKIDTEQRKYLEYVASHWNFMSVDEMKKLRIRYVIFNSVVYTSFLPNGHPRKLRWFCFENFPREDFPAITIVPQFNPNMPGISDVSRVRMFIYRRAHQFYDAFWKDKDIKLIKEFKPSLKHFGPFVEIYEINYDAKR